MKITDIQIIPVRQQESLIAFGSFVIDDSLRIASLGLHTRLTGEGLRVVFPAKKVGVNLVFYCQPLNQKATKEIEKAFTEKAKEIGLFNFDENEK